MAVAVHHHRSTLKQVRSHLLFPQNLLKSFSKTNKPFKSKHATKSSLKDLAKGDTSFDRLSSRSLIFCTGKVSRQPVKTVDRQKSAAQLKQNRKNAAKQAQVKKRLALVSTTKLFSGVDGAPRVVAVIPLSEDVNAQAAAKAFAGALDAETDSCPAHGLWKLK